MARSRMRFASRVRVGAKGPLGRRRGFVLVIVIWSVGLISLLALTVIRSADTFGRIAANNLSNAQAEALADAGVNLAVFRLANERWASTAEAPGAGDHGEPVFCRMDDAVAAISTEDEGGKVDLNAAPPGLLTTLLIAASAEPEAGRAVAAAIDGFRTAPGAGAKVAPVLPSGGEAGAQPYKHALFESTSELEQVPGMTSGLLRALMPVVTVYSHQPGFDPSVAPTQLAAMLGSGSLPAEEFSRSPSNSFLIRAEVLQAHHADFVREAIVEFPLDAPRRLFIREWRRGARRFGAALEGRTAASIPPC